MLKSEIATFDEAADIRAFLLDALKLLAEMQRNRTIAPAYKKDVERILFDVTAQFVLPRGQSRKLVP